MTKQKENQVLPNNLIYKIVPCYSEARGNLRMVGMDYPVEFKEVKNLLVVHVKEDLGSDVMFGISQQLKKVFGDQVVLFAFKNDVSFFVAEPMEAEEVEKWIGNAAEKVMGLMSKGVM